MNNSTLIKAELLALIKEMEQYHWLFTRNPETDFTRIKKWSFSNVMRFIISMEGKSLKDELLDYFNFSNDTPTNSSFISEDPKSYQKLLNFFSMSLQVVCLTKNFIMDIDC